jgi:hypothetical protein
MIDESDLQYKKHSNSRISTFLENADDSIRVKCEFDSNVIDESDLQHENILVQEFQPYLE